METTVKVISRAPRNAACNGGFTRFEIPGDVLQHDDRVVHHEAGGDRERHERQILQAVVPKDTSPQSC